MHFLFIGIQSWDIEIGSNAKNLAQEISKRYPVLFINLPLERKSLWTGENTKQRQHRIEVRKKHKEAFQKISPKITVYTPPIILESINWLPQGFLFKLAKNYNTRRFAKTINKALKELSIKDFILLNDSLMHLGTELKQLLNPKAYVYYIRDYLISQPYFRKHGKKYEPIMCQEADLVVTNSIYLQNYASHNNKHAYMVGQGCDVSQFSNKINSPSPKDIVHLDSPKIGYVGFLTKMRLDLPMLERICFRTPQWQWIFVGPEDEAFQHSSLHSLTNVTFTGSKNPDQLPEYVNAFDVCINPQVVNDMTIGNYPRKIDEYLAMGKPVVATKTTAMEYFNSYVYLAFGDNNYIAAIQKALQQDSPKNQKERIAYAQTHTWENNVMHIYQSIYSATGIVL